jgi:hypothetical protein
MNPAARVTTPAALCALVAALTFAIPAAATEAALDIAPDIAPEAAAAADAPVAPDPVAPDTGTVAETSAPVEPAPFPEVQSKRLKPPAPGTAKRITVQLTEIPDFRRTPGPMTIPPGPRGPWVADEEDNRPRMPTAFDWYWAAVSPSLDQSGPARVTRAIEMVAQGPAGEPLPGPRLQSLQQITDRYGTDILKATIGTRVSPALVLAMIAVESSGRTEAVSSAGAVGLMQLMPATAERFGVADRTKPHENIKGGVAYMDWLLQEFQGDAVMALAGYNAGENAVKRHLGVPPYDETRAYVPKVLAAWTVARGLCLTPPELLSDPCVFVGRQAVRSN